MQRKAYALMEIPRRESPLTMEAFDRMTALVKLGAVVVTNCSPTITQHLTTARSAGATESELRVTAKLAKMISGKAGEFADQAISDALGGVDE